MKFNGQKLLFEILLVCALAPEVRGYWPRGGPGYPGAYRSPVGPPPYFEPPYAPPSGPFQSAAEYPTFAGNYDQEGYFPGPTARPYNQYGAYNRGEWGRPARRLRYFRPFNYDHNGRPIGHRGIRFGRRGAIRSRRLSLRLYQNDGSAASKAQTARAAKDLKHTRSSGNQSASKQDLKNRKLFWGRFRRRSPQRPKARPNTPAPPVQALNPSQRPPQLPTSPKFPKLRPAPPKNPLPPPGKKPRVSVDNFRKVQHDLIRWRRRVISLREHQQRMTRASQFWKSLQLQMARYRVRFNEFKKFDERITKTRKTMNFRNNRELLYKASMDMERLDYRETAKMVRELKRKDARFQKSIITKVGEYFANTENAPSNWLKKEVRDVFY